MNDFDLIFFHTDEYPYTLIQTACSSNWCHVALVLRLTRNDVDFLKEKVCKTTTNRKKENICHMSHVFLLESTIDLYPCAITGKYDNGVKLCRIEDRFKMLGNVAYGRKKSFDNRKDGTKVAKYILMNEILPYLLGIPYERNLMRFLKAFLYGSGIFIPGFLNCCLPYDGSSMFCTELLTFVFTRLGILNANDSNDIVENERTKGNVSIHPYDPENLSPEEYVKLEEKYITRNSPISYQKIQCVVWRDKK